MKGRKSRKEEMQPTHGIPHVLPAFMSFMLFMVRSPLPIRVIRGRPSRPSRGALTCQAAPQRGALQGAGDGRMDKPRERRVCP